MGAFDENKINKMVEELEALKFFGILNRFPQRFYNEFNQEEKAEVVKRYRQRNGLGKPYKETK